MYINQSDGCAGLGGGLGFSGFMGEAWGVGVGRAHVHVEAFGALYHVRMYARFLGKGGVGGYVL